jgi:hypothetical protein
MEQSFILILQKLLTEQDKEALLNPAKCKAFLADYTHGEYKKESRLLLQAIEAGVSKAIDNTNELSVCKQQQVRVLQDEYFLKNETAADVVDTLSLVLKGDKTKIEIPKQEAQSLPIQSQTPVNPAFSSPIQTPKQTFSPITQIPPNKKYTKLKLLITFAVMVFPILAFIWSEIWGLNETLLGIAGMVLIMFPFILFICWGNRCARIVSVVIVT